ncbi:hypothetical protein ACLB2K_022966 [Fragaria x ananassa]
MVGSASIYSKQGNLLEPAAVLKLYNVKSSSNVTSLITGTLKSLINSKNDPNFFGPISMSMLSFISYKYTYASNKSHHSYFEGSDVPSSSLNIGSFCRVFSSSVLTRQFPLRYSSRCVPGKNCSPLAVFYSPRTVSLKNFECLEDKRRLRVLVDFADNRYRQQLLPFSTRTTLVGEGSWDAEKNQLCVVACQFMNVTATFNNTHIGDCTTILSVRFPAIWTMRNSSSIFGQIWSTKNSTEWGYFENITFGNDHRDAADRLVLQGQKYEYTKVDKVTKSCPRKNSTAKKKNNIYPNPFSFDMRFDMWAKNSTAEIAWGYAVPLSVDIQFYHMYIYSMEDGTEEYSVGYMIPLMLNFDAMFTRHSSPTVFLGRGWLELNEVIVRVVTMVGFLLQIRLLQLTMSAKSVNGNQKELWAVEKLALFVALPVYVAGCLVGLFLMNWGRVDTTVMVSSGQEHQMVGTILGSCGGLVLDAFLFPQILLNMFSKSIEKVLSDSFYIGTTLVRVLPHAYDLYRAHTSAHQLEESYIYASPAADFYSTAWNVIIPRGCLLFAVIIYLQQRFGGPCILPKKYEQVPIASEAS